MQVSTDMLRGYTDVILLAQLDRGDSYGYAITRSVAQASQHAYEIKEGTLYAAFKRLEEAGLIRAYWGEETHGGRRRYFAITQAGMDKLCEERKRWKDTKAVLNRLLGEEEEAQHE
ncbi:MAG: helix-turn-helix transcriptional regulator [Clostridia bacterium]|nr:helix-turn-helix transcriptional regulator [Clostridia bacterium]MBR2288233.1 helix-turn-helix transcriptional regulator [Clostridia bacterium]